VNDALERGQLEHLDVVLGDLAADLDVDLLGDLAGEAGEDAAELLGERDAGPDVLGDHAALDVDRRRAPARRTAPAGPTGPRRRRPSPGPRRSDAPRCGVADHVLELEQRAVGARLGREHVEAGGAMRPSLRAAYSAASSTMPPRAGVDRGRATDLALASCSTPIRPAVSGVLAGAPT
jgi:hypothetical protein